MATQKRKRSSAKTKRPTSSSKKGSKKRNNNSDTIENRILVEILFLLVLAFSILLFLSNLGLCGIFGKAVSSFFFGVFGLPEYVFPFCFFFGFIFMLSNRHNMLAVRKLIGGIGLLCFICAFIQLLVSGYEKNSNLIDFYLDCAHDRSGGGLIGGTIVKLCGMALGSIGAAIVIIFGLLIFTIVMTQEPLLRNIHAKGMDVYESKKQRMQEMNAAEDEEEAEEAEVKENAKEIKEAVPKKASVKPKKKSRMSLLAKAGFGEEEDEEEEELAPVPRRTPRKRVDFNLSEDEDLGAVEDVAPAIKELPEADEPMTAPVLKTRAGNRVKIVSAEEEAAEAAARSTAKRKKTPSKGTKKEKAVANEEMIIPPPALVNGYQFPSLNLLHKGEGNASSEDVKATARKLQETLQNFGVDTEITEVNQGPTVTRYEFQPPQGVKVSKIVSLQDDIKLNLAASDIRIEAPIPGKAAIGIEVPNKKKNMVVLRDLLSSTAFQKAKSDLSFAVGKDIAGKPVIADLAKMPHLLIAGTTGSGKSVCINSLIVSMIYKASPDDVKFIMIDPKMVELSVYNGIPHLYIPVVTDPKKAAGALNWAVQEMTERYNKFAGVGVRDLKGYNAKVAKIDPNSDSNEAKLQKMPRIVIIVDELADLMMVAQHDVEDAIVRLSQLARAAGIHLVIATQRPSVNVITGLIKANMPSRVALSVSSGIDSRTILDMNGAEKLLGNGDMLFYPQSYQKPARIQGAYISDEEIMGLVEYLRTQNKEASYDHEAVDQINQNVISSAARQEAATDDRDVYFAEAGRLIIDKEKASIGQLQRAFKIGFNRAARIMDQLCEAGVVGPEEGTKPRKVLISAEEFEKYLEDN